MYNRSAECSSPSNMVVHSNLLDPRPFVPPIKSVKLFMFEKCWGPTLYLWLIVVRSLHSGFSSVY